MTAAIKAARELYQQYRVSPAEIARLLEIELRALPLDGILGLLTKLNGWVMVVNDADTEHAIAHMLGHLRLHTDVQPCFVCKLKDINYIWLEAEAFANELLRLYTARKDAFIA